MFAFFKSNTSLKTFIFLLTKYEKISWGISNNTGKTSTEVAYLFNWKPEIFLVAAKLTLATMQYSQLEPPSPYEREGGGGVVGPCKN